MSSNITIKIPVLLDLLFVWPILLYRRLKFGFSFRKIPLGNGLFASVCPLDFYWLNKFHWYVVIKCNLPYAVRNAVSSDNKNVISTMHREIMSAPKDLLVDHRNGNTLLNHRDNLRLATYAQNNCNRRKINKITSSRFIGVSIARSSKKWQASISSNRKSIYLGRFSSEIEAARVYDRAAVKYHGEFSRLNFPLKDYIHSKNQKPSLCLAFLLVLCIMVHTMSKQMKFTKMHGIGNDFVFVDCFRERVANPAKTAVKINDRHFGVGSDGLILICPSKKADAKMRMFNADGSESEMCGNGIRCVAKYVFEHKLAKPGPAISMADGQKFPASLNIETKAGVLTLGLSIIGKTVQSVCVNMGEPKFRPEDIPVKLTGERVVEQPIEVLGRNLSVTCVSMGNPHAVFFCDDVDGIELDRLGPAIENHELFPRRINVHFVQVVSKDGFRMRTWERGSGLTLACGTGSCACAVAAAVTNRCN